MKNLRQLFIGLLTAIGSSLIVLTAGTLAIMEGRLAVPIPVISTPTAPAVTPSPAVTGSPIPTIPGETSQPTLTFTLSPTQTEVFRCQKTPKDWIQYMVKAGDTLDLLAAQTGLTPNAILDANCLVSSSLLEGTILYLPFTGPTATIPPALPTAPPTNTITFLPTQPIRTPVPCGPPAGWVIYIVKSGENLYRLSLAFGISQYQLQTANCLTSVYIYAGQRLYVPNVPTRTPVYTSTVIIPTPLPSDTPAPSSTPVKTTPPAKNTPTHTPSPTHTATSTLSPPPIPPTATPTATDTPVPPTATTQAPPTATPTP